MTTAATIYHNPQCGTSRNVLALIRASGTEPTVIEYLRSPPDQHTLRTIAVQVGGIRNLLRIKGTPYQELGLADENLDDDYLIDQMVRYPLLINRPIVITARGSKLCRPSDLVLDLLPPMAAIDRTKEDGTPVLVDTCIDGNDAQLRAALQASGLPIDDLGEPGRVFYRYATLSRAAIGYGGFEQYGEDVLLRSLVAPAGHRGIGMGRSMLALLMRRAHDAGARKAWLLTTWAAAFFERAGFKVADRGSAPATILGTRQASTLCPASAAFLVRSLTL
ncbi:MAG: arsenic resistance N-acetyltransferase ArsN2 [Steroidobacteraceae bacterium]